MAVVMAGLLLSRCCYGRNGTASCGYGCCYDRTVVIALLLWQDWDGELIENGAFYFTKKETLQKLGCRLGGKMALHEMAEHTLTELDSLVDWEIVSHVRQTSIITTQMTELA